ncbi:MAG: tannase, partial [Lachnospiraceae bacterium]|nr:tannase [Lachnospiraceae bacterium]
MWKKKVAIGMAALMIGTLTACGTSSDDVLQDGTDNFENTVTGNAGGTVTDKSGDTVTDNLGDAATDNPGDIVTNLDKIDMSKWMYHSGDNVYYQVGISYCETPVDASYETLAVFVPGDYFSGTDNGDGTYTCEINSDAKVNGYTAQTAPIVMPIETPGYTAQAALTGYTSLTGYMESGFVYVHAGCRGRDAGAPAGVTDLKAAIRYLRYIDDIAPGDAEKIFVFGMSGGGAQSALVGATGDSGLYDPYLEQIGAVQGVSDAVYGSMDWCPITNLDSADAAYEWMMGVTRNGLSEENQAISDALATAFADYINQAGIKDENGNILTLEESADGIFQAGSYYDYIVGVIEESLNNFLSDTEFPYNASASGGKGGGFGGMGGRGEIGDFGGLDGDFGGIGEMDGNFDGFKGMGGKGEG